MNSEKVKTILILVTAVILILALPGCGRFYTTGSGNIISQERDVEGFNAISMSIAADILIEQSGVESLKIEGDDNILEKIVTSVTGNELSIEFDTPGMAIRPSKRIEIRIKVKDLNAVELSGEAKIAVPDLNTHDLSVDISGAADTSISNLSAYELDISLSGAGSFDISGVAERQDVSISGTGSYNADQLLCKVCDLSISGAGSAVVNVSDKLDVEVSGVGSVTYIGDPKVTQSISGAGTIKKK